MIAPFTPICKLGMIDVDWVVCMNGPSVFQHCPARLNQEGAPV